MRGSNPPDIHSDSVVTTTKQSHRPLNFWVVLLTRSHPSVMLRLQTYLQDANATILHLVDAVGLEPTMPEAEDLQSPGVTNFPTHP